MTLRENAPVVLAGHNITKAFGATHALRGVDFEIRAGEVVALIGENGAGKSTLMKILSGVQPPTSGTIELDGEPIAFASTTDAVAHGVAIVHQELNLCPNLSVVDNIFLGREITTATGLARGKERVEALAALEKLEEPIDPDALVGDLRLGQQQLVEIARALAEGARVLIMDEPFSGFDPINAELIKQELLRLKAEGKTIILSTHNMQSVEELCDDIVLINQGHIILRGQTEEVRRSYSTGRVRLAYDGELPPSLASDLRIVERQATSMGGLLWLEAEGLSLRELVASLPAELDLRSLERELPSMHEIFLSAVSQSLSSTHAHE